MRRERGNVRGGAAWCIRVRTIRKWLAEDHESCHANVDQRSCYLASPVEQPYRAAGSGAPDGQVSCNVYPCSNT